MVALTLQNSIHKILVIGAIYDNIDKLLKIKSLQNNYDYIIFNGNLCYPNNNLDLVRDRIEIMEEYLASGKIIYNVGQFDLQLMAKLEENNPINHWIKNKPNVIYIAFSNQSSIIITNGGLTPQTTKNDLYDNLELSFISYIDQQPWHHWYGGNLGYVISNNPLTQDAPKFYNYSAQIGNRYSSQTMVYAQEIDQFGLKKTFSL